MSPIQRIEAAVASHPRASSAEIAYAVACQMTFEEIEEVARCGLLDPEDAYLECLFDGAIDEMVGWVVDFRLPRELGWFH